MGIDVAALIGQLDAAGAAVKKLNAEVVLEGGHVPAEGRLAGAEGRAAPDRLPSSATARKASIRDQSGVFAIHY